MNPIRSKLLIRIPFVIFALVYIHACIYEPTDVYDIPVETEITSPDITNVELNFNADTIWVYGNQNIQYYFKSSNNKQSILATKLYIDGIICDYVTTNNGEFDIKESALNEGVHTLEVILNTKTGSGSIADRLNSEVLSLSKKWVLVADYSEKKVNYTVENGYLKVYWDKYKNLDIKRYIVNNSNKDENAFYTDSVYYGAEKTYTVKVEKNNGDIINWGSFFIKRNIPQPELKVSDDNEYYLTWNKSPYYNAVKYVYRFYNEEEDYYATTGEINGSDTIYTTDLYFNDSFMFSLYTIPKDRSEYISYPPTSFSGYAGEPVNIRYYTSYTSADTLSAYDIENTYKYFVDGTTVSKTPIMEGRSFGLGMLQLSPKGEYLLNYFLLQNNAGTGFFAKNLKSGNIYYSDSVDVKYNLFFNNSVNISDNGIGLFHSTTEEFLFDFSNNKKIASREFALNQGYQYRVKLANDGKHFISSFIDDNNNPVTLDVFKIAGTELEKMYSLDLNSSDWSFNSTDPNMIILVKDRVVSVIQCEPYSLLLEIELASDEEFKNVDYFSNEILIVSDNRFIIRSLTTGEVIKSIPKRPGPHSINWQYRLHNNQIIVNHVMLKIR